MRSLGPSGPTGQNLGGGARVVSEELPRGPQ